jgi:gas vesicle protein
MSDERGAGAGTVLLSFLAGAAIGAGAALLLAPKTGEEVRGKIAELAEDAVDSIKEHARQAQQKIADAYEDSKETLKQQKSILTSAIEAGKEAMDKEREKLRNG